MLGFTKGKETQKLKQYEKNDEIAAKVREQSDKIDMCTDANVRERLRKEFTTD